LREITELLLDEGHRRIALLGRLASASYHLRSDGYQQALRGAGIVLDPALEIEVDNWTANAGGKAIRSYLTRHELPHAIICCTDSLAMGVLSALWGDGYRVPDDVSVAGYDDVPEAAALVPPLTTVHFDRAAMAEAALDLLARRIADPTRSRTFITLPHSIVRRQSTRPPLSAKSRPLVDSTTTL
jgi:DNA-binding LacI/PurR family transcriptional regulator